MILHDIEYRILDTRYIVRSVFNLSSKQLLVAEKPEASWTLGITPILIGNVRRP